MNSEILKMHESLNKTPKESLGGLNKLDSVQISTIIRSRKQVLEKIKNEISRKVYFYIEEKINREEKELNDILDWQTGKSSHLAKFTLILDPHYFEQEFLS